MTGLATAGPVSDVLCAALVYAYVFIVLFVVERLYKGDQAVGRKILHVGIGNVVFLLWLPTGPWTALVVAGSFVVFTLLITRRMQRRFLDELGRDGGRTLLSRAYRHVIARLSTISVSAAGNEFGLVYYCIAFLALAVLFYDRPIVVAAGMLPLAYGDGMGAVVGLKYGAHRYAVFDRKSIEGSLAVFAATAAALSVGLAFYGMPLAPAVGKATAIGAITALVEAVTPRGLDNLSIPAAGAIALLLLGAAP